MARVRVCKFCQHPNPADELFCRGSLGGELCGRSLQGLSMVDQDEISAAPTDEPKTKAYAERTTREIQDTDEPAFAILECPCGQLEVADSIAIGRDALFCPKSAKFSGYMTVSGVHARVFYCDNKWFVQDLGSTNGTFLNGVQLGANVQHLVSDGDQLHFSRSFKTVFRANRGRE